MSDFVGKHSKIHDTSAPVDGALDHAIGKRTLVEQEYTKIARRLAQRSTDGARDDNGVAVGAEHALTRADSSMGQALPDGLKQKFEGSLGADLSRVRVHTGSDSAGAADAVGARAYTTGNDVHFAQGEYDPSSRAGQHLLAHEVAHTVQQSSSSTAMQAKFEVSSPVDAAEHEADHAADHMLDGTPTTLAAGTAGTSRNVQRVEAKDVPAKPKIADIGQAGWMSVIPDAIAKEGTSAQKPSVSGHQHAKGQFTNFDKGTQGYAVDKQGNEIATSDKLGDGVDQAKVDAEVAKIVTARAAIHARHFVDGGKGYAGVVSMPQYENAKKDQESADAAKGYQGWLKTAVPTIAKDPKDVHWQIYKMLMGWEGDPSAMNAYDQVNVTWGSGFSGAGPVMELILRVFQKSPEIKDAFFNAGVTIGADGNFCVVDPDKKWKLHDADAQLYVRTHQELLAMMVNCAQGVFQAELANKGDKSPDPRQAVLDANFETFMTGAGNSIPSNVLGWSTEEAALAAHAVHAAPGIYKWVDLSKLVPHTTTDIAQFIYDKSHVWFTFVVVPEAWRAAVKKDPPKPKEDGKKTDQPATEVAATK